MPCYHHAAGGIAFPSILQHTPREMSLISGRHLDAVPYNLRFWGAQRHNGFWADVRLSSVLLDHHETYVNVKRDEQMGVHSQLASRDQEAEFLGLHVALRRVSYASFSKPFYRMLYFSAQISVRHSRRNITSTVSGSSVDW